MSIRRRLSGKGRTCAFPPPPISTSSEARSFSEITVSPARLNTRPLASSDSAASRKASTASST
jgi:hypothetical protein